MKSSGKSAYLSLRLRVCLTYTSQRLRLTILSLGILITSLVYALQEPSIVVCKINYPDKLQDWLAKHEHWIIPKGFCNIVKQAGPEKVAKQYLKNPKVGLPKIQCCKVALRKLSNL